MQQILIEHADFDRGAPCIGQVEHWCVERGWRYIVGVDEAGRGPLAGPVVAAAVVLDLHALDAPWVQLLDDSKRLSAAARDAAFDAIQQGAFAFGVAQRDHQAIDQMNILQATFRSMEEATQQALANTSITPSCVFIDGNKTVKLALAQRAVVKGDARSRAIAAASILAKVTRDRMMDAFDARWPQYQFSSNKGYPTQAHRAAIEAHGPCPIHRRTFRGVREFLEE